MKSTVIIIALSIGILMSGCTVIDVNYDYDAGFDFSNLSQYNWLKMPVDYPVDSFSYQRVKTAVDQQMKNKGFTLTESSGDFIVSLQGYKNTVRQAPQSTNVSRVTGQRLENEQFQEGMFTITIIDAISNRLIWQGHGKGLAAPNLSTEDRVSKINETVAKLLANFPPVN